MRSFLSLSSFIFSLFLIPISPVKASEIPKIVAETSVVNLSDISVIDWAFEALRSLIERYGCVAGYPNRTYRGNKFLTRDEFVATLASCSNSLEDRTAQITVSDRKAIEALQAAFEVDLQSLTNRLENLEARTTILQSQQFSTTAKLSIASVFVVSDLEGDTADGNPNSEIDSNLVVNHRTRFNVTSSFTGQDRLMVRLQSSDRVPNFNGAADTNMTRLSFEVGNTDNSLRLNLLEYRFPIGENLQIYLYGNAASHHYYATVTNSDFASFGGGKGTSSRFLDRNPIYRLGFISPAGVAAVYDTEKIRFDVGYLAENAEETNKGLFGDTYSALAQFSLQPSENLALGLTYLRHYSPDGNLLHRTGSNFANVPFGEDIPVNSNAYGLEAAWQISSQVSLSGWLGYIDTHRVDDIEGNAEILNFALNLALLDLFQEGSVAGLGWGMPPKVIDNTATNRKDPGTSLHFEAFYQYSLSDNIKLIPGIIYLTNADHDGANNDIFVGTFRTVFSF